MKKPKTKKKGSKATKSKAIRNSNSGHADVRPGIDGTTGPTDNGGRDEGEGYGEAAGALVVVG
jgi:hypothetical protein